MSSAISRPVISQSAIQAAKRSLRFTPTVQNSSKYYVTAANCEFGVSFDTPPINETFVSNEFLNHFNMTKICDKFADSSGVYTEVPFVSCQGNVTFHWSNLNPNSTFAIENEYSRVLGCHNTPDSNGTYPISTTTSASLPSNTTFPITTTQIPTTTPFVPGTSGPSHVGEYILCGAVAVFGVVVLGAVSYKIYRNKREVFGVDPTLLLSKETRIAPMTETEETLHIEAPVTEIAVVETKAAAPVEETKEALHIEAPVTVTAVEKTKEAPVEDTKIESYDLEAPAAKTVDAGIRRASSCDEIGSSKMQTCSIQ